MIAIRLTFPAGRYHATPWGRHVNEGVSEWPPSPYRLLRALYDLWQRKCPDLASGQVSTVLMALAESAPRFSLPASTATHIRSYLSANQTDTSKKNLVFDSFLAFELSHQCFLHWPDLILESAERQTLQRLLENLNYLGRSESWVEATLWNDAFDSQFECLEVSASEQPGQLIRVACAIPPSEYSGKLPWMDALTFSTTDLLKEHASSPPLLKSVPYVLPDEAILTDPPPPRRLRETSVQEVLLSLHATVLPLVTSTLEIAEQIRVRLMGAHRIQNGGDLSAVSPLFSGKEPEGGRRLDHGHVYILPLGNTMGRIDRVLVRSKNDSFSTKELNAVRGVRKLYQADDRGEIQCLLTWQGNLYGSPVHRQAKVVESATPFVFPRYWRKGRDFDRFFVDEILRECGNHEIESPVKVERLASMPGIFHEIEYRRNRKDDPVRPGYPVRLTFESEVPAPFSIGYGSHFGLGQFGALGNLVP